VPGTVKGIGEEEGSKLTDVFRSSYPIVDEGEEGEGERKSSSSVFLDFSIRSS
jgi:hypothetical protein